MSLETWGKLLPSITSNPKCLFSFFGHNTKIKIRLFLRQLGKTRLANILRTFFFVIISYIGPCIHLCSFQTLTGCPRALHLLVGEPYASKHSVTGVYILFPTSSHHLFSGGKNKIPLELLSQHLPICMHAFIHPSIRPFGIEDLCELCGLTRGLSSEKSLPLNRTHKPTSRRVTLAQTSFIPFFSRGIKMTFIFLCSRRMNDAFWRLYYFIR